MINFDRCRYNFWKQSNPNPFDYNQEYKNNQSTNTLMSWLRIGWLSSFFSPSIFKKMNVVDIGSGNDCFIKASKNIFKRIVGYDVAGTSISHSELMNTEWDLVILSDVLEHFEDINKIFEFSWKYIFISFPETPKVDSNKELSKWKHYKPDEHIWCLNLKGMKEWLEDNSCKVIGSSHFEDLIRTCWEKDIPNISSILAKRIHHGTRF